MRRRRVLFTACLTSCTLMGAASAAVATASALGQGILALSPGNLRFSLLLGGGAGQLLGLVMSSVLITAGDIQGLTIHALKGAAATGAVTAILIWFPLWVLVKTCAGG